MIQPSPQLDFPTKRPVLLPVRCFIRTMVLVWTILFAHVCLPQMACSQQKEDMPWYDAEKQGVAPVGIEVREKNSGAEHNSIPDYVPRTSRSNPSSTGGTGIGGAGANVAAGLGSMMSILVWSIGILIVCALLGLLLWAVLGRKKEEDEDDELFSQRTMAESIKQLPFEIEEAQKGDFRSLAHQLYQQGDLRRAMILLFSHVLVSLDQKSLVRLKKGKTNRQYLRELAPYQTLSGYFSEVMVRFEEAFFGDREIERSSFESCWNRLDEFEAGLESTQIRTEV